MSSTKLNERTPEQRINDLTNALATYQETISFQLKLLNIKFGLIEALQDNLGRLVTNLCFIWSGYYAIQTCLSIYKLWLGS